MNDAPPAAPKFSRRETLRLVRYPVPPECRTHVATYLGPKDTRVALTAGRPIRVVTNGIPHFVEADLRLYRVPTGKVSRKTYRGRREKLFRPGIAAHVLARHLALTGR